ncbi:hypothetical protein [Streptomyces sp. NPDC049879]|uniref:hypothetical protein n=1 Tax=Streptomyces sp. NPDC049879 TaxID=3365598 RepID=UPI003795C6B7
MAWFTLLSAVVGALIATGSTAFLEQRRWRRDRHDQGQTLRRELYGAYLAQLSATRNDFRSLARDEAATVPERAATARDSFAPCYGLRYQVAVTAPAAVVTASEATFRRLRDMRETVSDGTLAGETPYDRAGGHYEDALALLRTTMRTDLGADLSP